MNTWQKFPIRILFQTNNNLIVKSGALRAINEWKKVLPGYVKIKTLYNPKLPKNPGRNDGFNSIYFADIVPDTFWAWTPLDFKKNEIISGDIELNPRKQWGEEEGAFRIILHEFGHFLGLGHSEVKDSIMAPDGPARINSLRPDDIAKIKLLYP